MNERIKELAEQSGAKVSTIGGIFVNKTNMDIEKFAELIVGECVEQLELVRKYRYDRVQPFETQQTIIDECQYQIRQHFGVE